jgi:hypothetical protein
MDDDMAELDEYLFELWVEDNGLTGMTLKEIEEYFAKKNNRGE